MRVAVFGSTGRAGALVTQTLLDRGYDVIGVSRSGSDRFKGKFTSKGGDMTSPQFLTQVIQDCDAFVFCIGQRLKSDKNLFSKNLSPHDIRAQIMRAIMQVLGSDSSKRFIYLSAFGVGSDIKKHALPFRLVLRLSSLGASYEDHNQAETMVRASQTAWTIVRPPGLNDKDEVVPLIDAKGKWSSFMNTSRKSVAEYLAGAIDRPELTRKTLTVIKEPGQKR